MPRVSVIIPSYNCERFVVQAVESVLAQTYTDYELIVVDDGSTDGTANRLSAYDGRLSYQYKKHGERSAARNWGLKKASGEFIAFLDADDFWVPAALQLFMQAVQDCSEAGVIFGKAFHVDQNGDFYVPLARPAFFPDETPGLLNQFEQAMLGCEWTVGALLVRTDEITRVGGFDESIVYIEDWDLWLRLSAITPFYFVDQPLLAYRISRTECLWDKQYKLGVHHHIPAMISANVDRYGLTTQSPELARRAMAWAYWRSALLLFCIEQEHRTAIDCVTKSLSFKPDFFDTPDPITTLAYQAIAFWGTEADPAHACVDYFERVVASLPLENEGRRRVRRVGLGELHAAFAFGYHEKGARRLAASHGLRSMLLDPSRMTNRGLWKVILRGASGAIATALDDRPGKDRLGK